MVLGLRFNFLVIVFCVMMLSHHSGQHDHHSVAPRFYRKDVMVDKYNKIIPHYNNIGNDPWKTTEISKDASIKKLINADFHLYIFYTHSLESFAREFPSPYIQ